jgi:hypothetical protein
MQSKKKGDVTKAQITAPFNYFLMQVRPFQELFKTS